MAERNEFIWDLVGPYLLNSVYGKHFNDNVLVNVFKVFSGRFTNEEKEVIKKISSVSPSALRELLDEHKNYVEDGPPIEIYNTSMPRLNRGISDVLDKDLYRHPLLTKMAIAMGVDLLNPNIHKQLLINYHISIDFSQDALPPITPYTLEKDKIKIYMGVWRG